MGRFTDKVKEVLARQIRDEEKVAGTIARVVEGESLIIVFTDGRWAHYREHSWGDIQLTPVRPKLGALKYANLLTDAECRKERKKEDIAWAEIKRKQEFAKLKRLQEKYPPEAQKAEAENADA